jgi:cell division protein FtsB
MTRTANLRIGRERASQALALFCLLAMGAWVLIGPSGLLAWSENNHLLAERQNELVQLKVERDELKNRVALLNPRQTDPDMALQLMKSNLNVVHPDEVVLIIE